MRPRKYSSWVVESNMYKLWQFEQEVMDRWGLEEKFILIVDSEEQIVKERS